LQSGNGDKEQAGKKINAISKENEMGSNKSWMNTDEENQIPTSLETPEFK